MASYYQRPLTLDEIYHHGIKGQKWGVRRFQNPDGTLTNLGKERYVVKKLNEDSVIKKGSAINRIANEGEKIDSTRKYVSLDDSYFDPDMIDQLPIDESKPVSYYEYKASKDLNKAGRNTVLDIFSEIYKDKKLSDVKFYKHDQEMVDNIIKKHPNLKLDEVNLPEIINMYKKYSEDSRYLSISLDDQYYVHKKQGFELASKTVSALSREEFIYGNESKVLKELEKKGYDALIDLEDSSIFAGPWGKQATIIINPEKSLKLKKEQKDIW